MKRCLVFIITNSILFYFIIVFIIHILWIAIDILCTRCYNNINLGKDVVVGFIWLYYGQFTHSYREISDRIN